MAKRPRKQHVKVKRKSQELKRKPGSGPAELVETENFVSLPEAYELTEEAESELQAFRANRVTFAQSLKETLKDSSTLDPEIGQAYAKVGKVLRTYRSGKLPKAFKLIPNLEHWGAVLLLTSPAAWSPQAMAEAVKLFSSSMNNSQCHVFYLEHFLPALRRNISKFKKLNYHYYQGLRKGLYKPAAWFKGILMPLAIDCSLKEAAIVGSVIVKASVPVLHAGAALVKLCEQEYSGAQSFFIKILLQKGFTMPGKVLQAVKDHFMQFETDDRQLPILWHQCLLTFVEKYGHSLSGEAKEELKDILKVHNHYEITPEIRKLLI